MERASGDLPSPHRGIEEEAEKKETNEDMNAHVDCQQSRDHSLRAQSFRRLTDLSGLGSSVLGLDVFVVLFLPFFLFAALFGTHTHTHARRELLREVNTDAEIEV